MTQTSCGRTLKIGSRREFLAKSSLGFGAVALNYLLDRDSAWASVLEAGKGSAPAPWRQNPPISRPRPKVLFSSSSRVDPPTSTCSIRSPC